MSSQTAEAKSDVLKCFHVLSDQQSKPQRYSIFYNIRQRQEATYTNTFEKLELQNDKLRQTINPLI